MTAEKQPWAEFDYAKMAEEALERAENLKAGMNALRGRKTNGMEEAIRRNAGLKILEEEYYEQKALCRLFRRRALERGQIN